MNERDEKAKKKGDKKGRAGSRDEMNIMLNATLRNKDTLLTYVTVRTYFVVFSSP